MSIDLIKYTTSQYLVNKYGQDSCDEMVKQAMRRWHERKQEWTKDGIFVCRMFVSEKEVCCVIMINDDDNNRMVILMSWDEAQKKFGDQLEKVVLTGNRRLGPGAHLLEEVNGQGNTSNYN